MNIRADLYTVFRRFIELLVVTWGVLTIVFFSLHIVPGDPVEVMLGENSSLSQRTILRESLGLDQTIAEQYRRYISNLLQGDMGNSLQRKKPVTEIISSRLPGTIQLALISMTIAVILSLLLGLLAAKYPYRWPDKITMFVSLLGISIPNFVLGPVLVLVFSLSLQWLPTSGQAETGSWVLPSIALGTAMTALLSRLLRASLLQTKEQPYVLAAKAKGVSQIRCWLVHILPNSLLPVITVLGLQLGTLLGGAVIVEIVFAWPGIGSLLIEAIEQRDYPVVQGCMLVITLAYLIINITVDFLYLLIDPRVT